MDRAAFQARFEARFADPRFAGERAAIDRLANIAWRNHEDSRKAPQTRPAGPGFADPAYELSVEWSATRDRLQAAQAAWGQAPRSRVLLVNGSARNDQTCPGENAKTMRLAAMARDVLQEHGAETDLLDLSLLTSDYDLHIHPCKGCVSTTMPLCHWPCSCYPNHSLGQVNDWMAEIYERWVAAHGVIVLAPTYWYQSPSPLKQMIDRLVCADGGNPDPTSTHGKKVEEAKALEKRGWDYPQHLAGRVFGLVVHGDVAGVEVQRRNLSDWLQWMGLLPAGFASQLDRYIGYYEPYGDSHAALDADHNLHAEVRNVAHAVARAADAARAGQLSRPDAGLVSPRRK
ncbi:flavodoxin family protein [Pseudorhodoferax sp. Leaf274]|uniref:flavodoxin family protein n=1 Tax=Pseudorhodoferax sp. Leaf274 TaxID=1736318 RepID=UPI000AAE0811|nr:NAD(P)H-dependent oxidoreductase [Pseudorhodoferax sp. Leaf274]